MGSRLALFSLYLLLLSVLLSGGEEFVVVLAASRPERAAAFAERVRTRFRSAAAKYSCTLSAGVAHRRADEELGDLMKRADQALYAAEGAGRDRVSVAS